MICIYFTKVTYKTQIDFLVMTQKSLLEICVKNAQRV